jgi:hypothetical protein
VPLNQSLYDALERFFGDVVIKDADIPMRYSYFRNPLSDRLNLIIAERGEHYWVNCNRCGDTRKRLSISAYWFHRDRSTGQMWSHLIHCFNEDCYADYETRLELHERLFAHTSLNWLHKPAPPEQVKGPPSDFVPSQDLPIGFQRLRVLRDDHPAKTYLLMRGFDPEEIDRLYQVGYADDRRTPLLVRKRLVIPAFLNRACVGWQARCMEELNFKADSAPPKYFTCPGMKRGQVVYNLDLARRYAAIVVVEGPTDVWRVGPMAVALWGSLLTEAQAIRLKRAAGHAKLVFMLDPDVMQNQTKLERNVRRLDAAFRGRIVKCFLPDGEDPGSCERKWLRDFIQGEAERSRVKIDLGKRPTAH